MTDTTRVWLPSDSNLTPEEQQVLSLEISKKDQIKDSLGLRYRIMSKLRNLMDQDEDPEQTLGIAPDLQSAAATASSNSDRAALIALEDSSLRELMDRVDLTVPEIPTTLAQVKDHREQDLPKMLGLLQTSLM
tara:strand:- start:336 stop:734 length:399 start_codon:yes stop_codon:yes gene_type:complete